MENTAMIIKEKKSPSSPTRLTGVIGFLLVGYIGYLITPNYLAPGFTEIFSYNLLEENPSVPNMLRLLLIPIITYLMMGMGIIYFLSILKKLKDAPDKGNIPYLMALPVAVLIWIGIIGSILGLSTGLIILLFVVGLGSELILILTIGLLGEFKK